MPVFHGLEDGAGLQDRMGELVIVEMSVTQECLVQIVPGVEMMGRECILNPSIEAFDHPVGFRRSGLRQTVFDVQSGAAQWVKFAVSDGLLGAAGEQPIGKFLAVISQPHRDADWIGLVQDVEEGPSVGCGFSVPDLDKHPLRGAVDDHGQIDAFCFIRHLRQAFDVDTDKVGGIAIEGPGSHRRIPVFHRTLGQAPHQAGAEDVRIQELPDHNNRSSDGSHGVRRIATASWAGVSVQCKEGLILRLDCFPAYAQTPDSFTAKIHDTKQLRPLVMQNAGLGSLHRHAVPADAGAGCGSDAGRVGQLGVASAGPHRGDCFNKRRFL